MIKIRLSKFHQFKKKKGIVNNTYLDAGQFWYASTKIWKKSKTVYDKKSFFMPTNLGSSDINTIKDWNNVRKIFKKMKKIF